MAPEETGGVVNRPRMGGAILPPMRLPGAMAALIILGDSVFWLNHHPMALSVIGDRFISKGWLNLASERVKANKPSR